MRRPQLDEAWLRWIDENLDRGCDKRELASLMLARGVDPVDCADALQLDDPRSIFLLPRRVPSSELEMFVLEQFLDSAECVCLVDIICANLRPSETTDDSDPTFRTSRTCDLGILDDEFVREVDGRICEVMGLAAELAEPTQGQYYRVGEEFRPHTDYFAAQELPNFDEGRGQRTWTFMVYLNRVEAGGGTYFPHLDQVFDPRPGMVLAWNNLRPDGEVNPATLHHGMPVRKGHKAIITKWFRQRPPG